DRAAGFVHVRLGLEQRHPLTVDADLRQRAGELRPPRAAVASRHLVEHEPAGVVAREFVLASRIAHARDQQIQRRAALAPTTKEAQLALGRAGLAPGALALGRRLASGGLFALRHLALGQLALLEFLALDLLWLRLDDPRGHRHRREHR